MISTKGSFHELAVLLVGVLMYAYIYISIYYICVYIYILDK